jgi:transcriptional regulator with XRE-family HTH domain
LHSRIIELCKEKGVSGSRMCLDLGLSKSTLSDIKSGRKKGFSADTAHKIASYLDVSVGYLLGEEEMGIKKEQPTEFDGLSEKRKALMQFAMEVPEDKAEMILQVMRTILQND